MEKGAVVRPASLQVEGHEYMKLTGELEPPQEEQGKDVEKGQANNNKKIHLPSLLCILSIGFIANCEYGVVMPSIWGYMQAVNGTETLFGIAVAASSFAQMCFLPIFGYWSDRRTMKEAICVSMIIGIIGNLLYVLAEYFKLPYLIILGRAFCGMYMGIISVTNSFVAMISTPETRTRYMAQINGFNVLGMVCGPGFNVFLTRANFKIGPFPVSANTSPGWFIAALVSLSFLFFLAVFKEPSPSSPTKHEMQSPINDDKPRSKQLSFKEYIRFIVTSFGKPFGACFVICFVQNFDFSVLETIATPLTQKFYNFTAFQNSLVYSALSVEMVIIIAITAAISKKVQDRYILLFAQACVGTAVFGMFFFYTKEELEFWMFSLLAGILIAGIPSQNISVMSLYSKLLTAEYGQNKQGLYTGIMMTFGSLARILGPLWGGAALQFPDMRILVGVLIIMWGFDVIFTLTFFNKLKPVIRDKEEIESLLAK